jgi:hypothetical protein
MAAEKESYRYHVDSQAKAERAEHITSLNLAGVAVAHVALGLPLTRISLPAGCIVRPSYPRVRLFRNDRKAKGYRSVNKDAVQRESAEKELVAVMADLPAVRLLFNVSRDGLNLIDRIAMAAPYLSRLGESPEHLDHYQIRANTLVVATGIEGEV